MMPVNCTGDSMGLVMGCNDKLMTYLKNDGRFKIKEGNIYIYEKENGGKVVHRLIKCIGDECIFKGDNNLYAETINKSQITAMVYGIIYG